MRNRAPTRNTSQPVGRDPPPVMRVKRARIHRGCLLVKYLTRTVNAATKQGARTCRLRTQGPREIGKAITPTRGATARHNALTIVVASDGFRRD